MVFNPKGCMNYFRYPGGLPGAMRLKPFRLLEHTKYNFYAEVRVSRNTIQQAVLINAYYAFLFNLNGVKIWLSCDSYH